MPLGGGLPSQPAKAAAVVDINRETDIPITAAQDNKRQNKNDFYRFLLQQNNNEAPGVRANNDILIPRSILKKCEKKAHNPHHMSDEE